MLDMQRWKKQAGRINTKTRRIKKGVRDNNREMIRCKGNTIECAGGV